jgi:hypothetical protein
MMIRHIIQTWMHQKRVRTYASNFHLAYDWGAAGELYTISFADDAEFLRFSGLKTPRHSHPK